MIVTDGIHVVSTTSLEELHQWAKDSKISRSWFHGVKKGHPHYDLPYRRFGMARSMKQVSSREIVQHAKRLHEQYSISPSKRNGSRVEEPIHRNESSLFKMDHRVGQPVVNQLRCRRGNKIW